MGIRSKKQKKHRKMMASHAEGMTYENVGNALIGHKMTSEVQEKRPTLTHSMKVLTDSTMTKEKTPKAKKRRGMPR